MTEPWHFKGSATSFAFFFINWLRGKLSGSTVAGGGDAFALAIICLNLVMTSESGLTIDDSVGLELEGGGVGALDIRISR